MAYPFSNQFVNPYYNPYGYPYGPVYGPYYQPVQPVQQQTPQYVTREEFEKAIAELKEAKKNDTSDA